MASSPKPAALIIGAGIAGIQAALDIASAGFPVVLVEREPSVGGRMSRASDVSGIAARTAAQSAAEKNARRKNCRGGRWQGDGRIM